MGGRCESRESKARVTPRALQRRVPTKACFAPPPQPSSPTVSIVNQNCTCVEKSFLLASVLLCQLLAFAVERAKD